MLSFYKNMEWCNRIKKKKKKPTMGENLPQKKNQDIISMFSFSQKERDIKSEQIYTYLHDRQLIVLVFLIYVRNLSFRAF